MSNSLVAIIMGSQSDWSTMKPASLLLTQFGIPHITEIVSAHRTPDKLTEFAKNAKSNGFKVIIAGAGGAAHLPGMVAAHTVLPVLGVPVSSQHLNGLDSLLSIVQMPKGIAVGTLAIGTSGATNAALFASQILALEYPSYEKVINDFRLAQTQSVLDEPDPSTSTLKSSPT